MPFAEGDLSVKYLGVPLISLRLFNKDCKVLVEKAKNRIGDWKNKSLSFAGRLQLCKSVISSVHDIPVKADMSWGWHKLLQLCDIVRRYFWMKIGDGASTSLWYDNWCSSSQLSRFFSHRDITNEGFHIQTKEADLISNGNWIWPQPWISKALILGQIVVSNIDGSRADVIQWKASNGSLSVFSVAKV
ncbi:hypothetical protein Tco_1341911 [Tanacetum coccineum]